MKRAYFNWSGGKDSALALCEAKKNHGIHVEYLLTSMNGFHNRVSMHGVRRELLEAQAASLNIPLTTIELPEEPSMQQYESEMTEKINWLKSRGLTHCIFGDIFLEDLRKYREHKLAEVGINPIFPIWKRNTRELMKEFLDLGFKAVTVCINEKFLDRSFCGRFIDEEFCNDLPPSVDICGENGEFHSFVFDGPIFQYPLNLEKGEVVYKEYRAPNTDLNGDRPVIKGEKTGFYFCDLLKA